MPTHQHNHDVMETTTTEEGEFGHEQHLLTTDNMTTKWAGLGLMVIVAISMFVGAFGAGLVVKRGIPAQRLMWLNVFGTGLLLGTALGVIIPEGIRSLYENQDTHHHHHHHMDNDEPHGVENETLVGWALALGFLTMLIADHVACCGGAAGLHGAGGHSHGGNVDMEEDSSLVVNAHGKNECCDGDHHHQDVEHLSGPSSGKTPTGKNPTTPSRQSPPVVSSSSSSATPGNVDDTGKKIRPTTISPTASVTFGLLIHNAADGLAMGASKASSSSWNAAQTSVYFAIMLHHVPAAFGYSAFLRSSRLEEWDIRRRMFLFSIMGPVSAIIAFVLLHPEFLAIFAVSTRAVGICLLFSGGTFLYVAAVHALDDATNKHKSHHDALSPKQLAVMTAGLLLPSLLAVGHSH